jgi:hypothetical protein
VGGTYVLCLYVAQEWGQSQVKSAQLTYRIEIRLVGPKALFAFLARLFFQVVWLQLGRHLYLKDQKIRSRHWPSFPHLPVGSAILKSLYLQGGSVTIASNKPPRLRGPWVISKVQRSNIRCSTPYCAAAFRIPGVSSTIQFYVRVFKDHKRVGLTFATHLPAVNVASKN